MVILGIADNHDASAALVVDGELVAACGQERIDRVKNSGVFPWGAIDAVLDMQGLRGRDVDRVVVGTSYTPSFLLRRFPGFHHRRKEQGGQFSPMLNAYIAYQVGLRKSGLWMEEVERCRHLIEGRLRDYGFRRASVTMMEHHQAHAHAAYRCQPRSKALILTIDAMGDGISCTASIGRWGQIDRHWEQSGFAAINTYYSRITEFLGFTPNRHEGKITGLAAYAEAPGELLAHFHKQLHFVGPGFNRTNYLRPQNPTDAFHRVLERYPREQIAAALQTNLERAVTAFVRYWVGRTEVDDVVVCGGVFANVKLNQRIAELDEVNSLFVFPNMGDGGLAVGAAVGSAGLAPRVLGSMYLGPNYDERACMKELKIAGLRGTRPENLAQAVAERLVAGEVVARFDGGMELGPRALGNRSLLVRPDSPDVNEWLNARLERSEFMPFAPVVLEEDAARLFRGWEKASEAARFMTVCFDVSEEMKQKCPGCVHVDGTARPQVLRDEENPGYAAILREFRDRTGIPALINTSFNMHEEPIVCSPFDAIRGFQRGRLDALVLGPYLVTS